MRIDLATFSLSNIFCKKEKTELSISLIKENVNRSTLLFKSVLSNKIKCRIHC